MRALTFRPVPVPADVMTAADSLAQACRLWVKVPFPLTSSGTEPPSFNDSSMEAAALCTIAEDPGSLDAGAYRALWFGVTLGAFGLWTLQLLRRLFRSGLAMYRRRKVAVS